MLKEKIDHRIDLQGKVCPYPTFETRLALKKMGKGETLEVILDYYPARQTIPDLIEELGYPCALIDDEEPIFRFVIKKSVSNEKEVK